MTLQTQTATIAFLQSAEAELLKDLRAGKPVDTLAAELAEEECAGDLTASDIAWGLRNLLAR